MKLKIIILLLFSPFVSGQERYVASIPLKCNDVEKELSKIEMPSGFNVGVFEAFKIAVNMSPRVKRCGSKLEQVIYADNLNYYFLNSVDLLIEKSISEVAVVVNGISKN